MGGGVKTAGRPQSRSRGSSHTPPPTPATPGPLGLRSSLAPRPENYFLSQTKQLKSWCKFRPQGGGVGWGGENLPAPSHHGFSKMYFQTMADLFPVQKIILYLLLYGLGLPTGFI